MYVCIRQQHSHSHTVQNLTQTSLKRLANDTATLYCKEPSVGGIQVDLEPFHGQYVQPMTDFIGYLSEFLRDENKTTGCRNDNFTDGRAVSYFCFAHDQNETFNKALGENGFYVFSLVSLLSLSLCSPHDNTHKHDIQQQYDLDPKPEAGGFMYNTPDEFAQRMRAEIPHIRRVVGNTQKFQIALPAGASCHEYETYVNVRGFYLSLLFNSHTLTYIHTYHQVRSNERNGMWTILRKD